MNKDDQELVEYVLSKSSLFDWWREFAWNIYKQGWISHKQREKLKTFNYEKELTKHFSCNEQHKENHWTAGLDHDELSDYTG